MWKVALIISIVKLTKRKLARAIRTREQCIKIPIAWKKKYNTIKSICSMLTVPQWFCGRRLFMSSVKSIIHIHWQKIALISLYLVHLMKFMRFDLFIFINQCKSVWFWYYCTAVRRDNHTKMLHKIFVY